MQPEELLHSIASGDREAFRKLYDIFQSRVYNTCLSYLQNAEDAEETTQDVFVDVYQSAASFRQRSTVSTWIYRIAINKCLDKLRYRNSKKRFAFISSLFGNSGNLVHDPPDFHHPGIRMENKEQAATLFTMIRRLPTNQQTAFILKHVEGLSQKEIGAIMELTQNAVESLLQRAKVNLRKYLTDKNEGN